MDPNTTTTSTNHTKNREIVLWDTGKVESSETLQIEYAGTPLKSLQRVRWKVQIWDENGTQCESVDKEDPFFDTGLLEEEAWGGSQWIARYGPLPSNASLCAMMQESEENRVPRFRSSFNAINNKKVVQARAYVVGLGNYQLFINGKRVGDSILDPGWTTYSKRVLYAAYDVTEYLSFQDGAGYYGNEENVVGVELGNGWWNPLPLLHNGVQNIRHHLVAGQGMTSSRPMFKLKLVGFQGDGSVVTLLDSSTKGWLAAGSPTTFNNIYLGEKYDARLEPAYDGWNKPNYNISSECADDACGIWRAPVVADSSGIGKVEAQEVPPIRKQRDLPSTVLSTRTEGKSHNIVVVDTGINHAGSCRVRVRNEDGKKRGSLIQFKYGELLDSEGHVNVMTSVVGQIKRSNPKAPCQPEIAYQQDAVVLGESSLDWTPSWSWHGFRYIEVTLPIAVKVNDLSIGCFTLRSDVDVVAQFDSSDPFLSDVRSLVRNTFESNMMSVQSDCPHRERFGYGGDALGCGEAALSIYDLSSFYRKRILDYNDAQRTDLSRPSTLVGFTETSPYVGIESAGLGPGTGPVGWETFQPEAQLWLYKYYGDTRTMKDSFAHTKAYIDLLDSEPKEIERGLGDWMPVYGTDVAYTGRGFQCMSYLGFANISEILGMPADISSAYRKKAQALVEQINSRFMDSSGSYIVGTGNQKGNNTQCGQAMALFNGYLSNMRNMKREALKRLIENAYSASNITGACNGDKPECVGGPGPHMTAGLFGIKWLLMALADGGLNDLAYDMVTTKTYPGLGWMMNNPFDNATTIWESFFFSDNTFSHNHPMFGSTEVWLLQSVAGIQPHPSAKGMGHILVRPNPPAKLQYVNASYVSPRGTIMVGWRRACNNTCLDLDVSIPPNCKGTVHIPGSLSSFVLHNGNIRRGRWVPNLLNSYAGSHILDIRGGRHKFRTAETSTFSHHEGSGTA